MSMPPEIMDAVLSRRRQIHDQIREADNLSEPCPPGRWRWADVKLSGYGRKSEPELAADRERNRRVAVDLRRRLSELEAWLEGAA